MFQIPKITLLIPRNERKALSTSAMTLTSSLLPLTSVTLLFFVCFTLLRSFVVSTFYRRQAVALLPDFVIRGAVQQLFTDKREEKIELMRAITIGTHEFQLTPLPQEVLLIWGDHDQIFPLEKVFAVKRCLRENVRLEILDKTGHVPQMEDPDRFNRVVLDFLLASQKPPSAQHDQ